MMFITPMPPTSSEIAATSPSSVVKTRGGGGGGFQQRALVDDLKAGFGGVLDSVALLEDLGDLGFGGGERGLGGGLDGDRVDRAVAREGVLHGGDRGDHDFVEVGDAVGALGGEHPDDLEVDAVGAHRLPHGVLPGEQLFGDGLPDHGDARVVGDVGVR